MIGTLACGFKLALKVYDEFTDVYWELKSSGFCSCYRLEYCCYRFICIMFMLLTRAACCDFFMLLDERNWPLDWNFWLRLRVIYSCKL